MVDVSIKCDYCQTESVLSKMVLVIMPKKDPISNPEQREFCSLVCLQAWFTKELAPLQSTVANI